MHTTIEDFSGLTTEQVQSARARYGWNKLESKPGISLIRRFLKEPMLVLLMIASTLYFATGSYAEGTFMLFAIFAVAFIARYQESKSDAALKALQAYTHPKASVIREGSVCRVATEELVMGDFFLIEEGGVIPADGIIQQQHDLSVNESMLTGESIAVNKAGADKSVYQGTLVTNGMAVCQVTAIGMQTRMGRIGKDIQEIKESDSPLQAQIKTFVRGMTLTGLAVFLVVWAMNFIKTMSLGQSLLKALTLAMSVVPEEIPVAFSTFMALGAWRLAQAGVIVKQANTVETLGSATVICVDKTGTLTKNEMELVSIYDLGTNKVYSREKFYEARSVIATAMWASEPLPFDPMEKAIHEAYAQTHTLDARGEATMVHEYPLSGVPPMMTHIFEDKTGRRIVAAKGAPEAFFSDNRLTTTQKKNIEAALQEMAEQGFRVLGVAEAIEPGPDFPREQSQFTFVVRGLLGFYDPPKENIASVLNEFYQAGIDVKIITGDNPVTTQTIAKQVHFRNAERFVTGDRLMALPQSLLEESVQTNNIFTRMFPEAKLKVIEALKKHHQVVAMTGDGVNDAPALKAAHIGIAMGRKGSEVAKHAAALILSNDDLSAMVAAITVGRAIYNNLKKAIRYIISIHIPIVLIVLLPLVFGWPYPEVFTPVHVIFLELIMGPTCSIVYEHEPVEQNVMTERPRAFTTTFFRFQELAISIIQGAVITAGLLFAYWYAINNGAPQESITSMVFLTLLIANVLLTLVNRSFRFPISTTIRYKNKLIPRVIIATLLLVILIFAIPATRNFFHLASLSGLQLSVCFLAAFISVMWIEVYKLFKR
jgi:Ca2+-transporting ATPase